MTNFQIRYLTLSFILRFTESGILPEHKISAIRGGIGNMLLMGNCIHSEYVIVPDGAKAKQGDFQLPEKVCLDCSFHKECLVQRIYYHPFEILPEFVQDKANAGYLYACDDVRTRVREGNQLEFQMTLFGNVIIHFPTILQAIYQLGFVGLGAKRVKFQLEQVRTHRGEPLLLNNQVCLAYLKPDLLEDYVRSRMGKYGERNAFEVVNRDGVCDAPVSMQEDRSKKECGIKDDGEMERNENFISNPSGTAKIHFLTPWTQKYQGEFLTRFEVQAFVDAVYRRVYLLNCFEGRQMERRHPFAQVMRQQEASPGFEKRTRYSGTHKEKIRLKGLTGSFLLENIPDEFWPYLFAGEILHIGKNCSMGFGVYEITPL